MNVKFYSAGSTIFATFSLSDVLKTVDFVENDETLVFRSCKKEKSHVVFQMGTADPERALKAAKMVYVITLFSYLQNPVLDIVTLSPVLTNLQSLVYRMVDTQYATVCSYLSI